MKSRIIVDPPPIHDESMTPLVSYNPYTIASASINFLGQDSSPWLLAACRRDESAWESVDGRGLFTRALLEVLSGITLNSLDYVTLIRN